MSEQRYRKGKKGLYYTNGRLDNNYHNEYHANFIQLYCLYFRVNSVRILDAFELLLEALCIIIYFICLPILPILQILLRKKRIKNVLTKEQFKNLQDLSKFNKDYYEELQ